MFKYFSKFGAVDHHDKVAVVHVRGELGLVLAAQAVGDLGGEAAENLAVRVHQVPLAIYGFRGRSEGFHGLQDSQSGRLPEVS